MTGPRIRPRAGGALALLAVAATVFLLFTALGVGESSHRRPASSAAPAPHYVTFSLEAPHVRSSYENVPSGAIAPVFPSARVKLGPAAFVQPIARYRAYAGAQLTAMQVPIANLQRALAANDRPAAEAAWSAAFARYLRLGAVYLAGELATLNAQIDGTPGGLPGGVADPRFAGLHEIEYGLWTGRSPASLTAEAAALSHAVGRLRVALPHVSITPLEYATRAHEILEDAQRDLLSGTDVPWSGEGVTGTAAGLAATEEVLATLHPFLISEDGTENGEPPIGPAIETELAQLRRTLSALARTHGGRLPTNAQLTGAEAERLDGALGGALEALSTVPGELESEPVLPTPAIPASAERIDP